MPRVRAQLKEILYFFCPEKKRESAGIERKKRKSGIRPKKKKSWEVERIELLTSCEAKQGIIPLDQTHVWDFLPHTTMTRKFPNTQDNTQTHNQSSGCSSNGTALRSQRRGTGIDTPLLLFLELLVSSFLWLAKVQSTVATVNTIFFTSTA